MSATSQYQGSTIHKDKALANLAVAYSNHELIADKICPVVPVQDISGTYFVRPKGNVMTSTGQHVIGPSSSIPEVEGIVEEQTYSCKGRGRESKISLMTDAMADVPLQLRQEAVLDAMAQLELERETLVRDIVFGAANYKATTNTAAISTKWDAKTSGVSDANPFDAIDALRGNIFRAPNTRLVAVTSWEVWKALKTNTYVLERLLGGATTAVPGKLLRQMFAELIEVDEILVGEAWAVDGAGTMSRVWGKHFAINAVATMPSTRSLCFSQTMRWQAPGPGGINHEQWQTHEGLMGVERHKITRADAEVVIANDAGILLTAAVS